MTHTHTHTAARMLECDMRLSALMAGSHPRDGDGLNLVSLKRPVTVLKGGGGGSQRNNQGTRNHVFHIFNIYL